MEEGAFQASVGFGDLVSKSTSLLSVRLSIYLCSNQSIYHNNASPYVLQMQMYIIQVVEGMQVNQDPNSNVIIRESVPLSFFIYSF